MDKNLKVIFVDNKNEVVFGKNKKFIGFKNSFTKKVINSQNVGGNATTDSTKFTIDNTTLTIDRTR